MFKHLLLSALAIFIIFAFTACTEGADPELDEIAYDDVVDLLEEIDEPYTIRGSCDLIASDSTCIDYIGSFWTEEQMKWNCSAGAFSTEKTCSYSNNGGCRATPGLITETILWSYQTGGKPISAEEAVYQAMACNANPAGEWTMPAF
jgi:hypothetical protein